MSDWKKYRLSDLMEIIGGGTPKTSNQEYWGGKIPWLSVTDFNNGKKYCYCTEKLITEKGLKESSTKVLKKGQLIISARGTVGVVSMLGNDMAFNQSNYGLNALEGLTFNDFLYYLIKNNISQLLSNSYGAVFDTITKETFEQIIINLPSLHEQKEIASVLSSLDNKIGLLQRQNNTLELIAETIFREWFLENNCDKDFIKLGDYVHCINGHSYKSSELNSSDIALVTLKSFDRNGGFKSDGFKEFTGKYKPEQVVKEGDLVIAHTDITQDAELIGNPALIIGDPKYKTMIITMDLVKIIPKSLVTTEFLYFLTKNREFKYHCLGCANGTTVLHLNKIAIPSFEIPKPDNDMVERFTEIAKPILSKIFKNHKEILTIQAMRDDLLPKLMNGEINFNI